MSANLTRLNLACPIHRGEDVHVFMKYVADSCQMLKSLALLFESVDKDLPSTDSVKNHCISFEILQPLLLRLNLTYVTKITLL